MAQFVRVENVTRGTLVADQARVARSTRDRMIGLLGSPPLTQGQGLWLERSPSIHMFFMRFAIDAIFVAADGRVTKVVERVRPWRVVWWAPGARDCLELPVGAIRASATQPGDRLIRADEAAEEHAGDRRGVGPVRGR
jgi:uncharacterized protein